MGERDAIADSDQGRSFRAFWDFLMSSAPAGRIAASCWSGCWPCRRWPTQTRCPHRAGALRLARGRRAHPAHRGPAFAAAAAFSRRPGLAGESPHHGHPAGHREQGAGAARDAAAGDFMAIAEIGADIELPMERPLYTPPSSRYRRSGAGSGRGGLDTAALFSQVVIDKAALSRAYPPRLAGAPQITLSELCERRPLQQGLAELVAYLQLAGEGFKRVVDEDGPRTSSSGGAWAGRPEQTSRHACRG